ncbi:MAG TPA: iron ABC transporter permease, partial [Beutenbergiaceae bacterium]|nr:iron ABC transporter permease [Beutenbergiaceae bacterium]
MTKLAYGARRPTTSTPPLQTATPPPASTPKIPASRRVNPWVLIALAVVVLVVFAALSLSFGTIRISPVEALQTVFSSASERMRTVVWSIRLPRVVVAMIVGGALAGVGVVMQTVFRNPLADPGITGVSAGGAVGAVAGITLGFTGSMQWGIPIAAFVGSLAVVLVLNMIIYSPRSGGNYTIILVGVSINAFAGALISILVANARDDALARGAVFWLAGDLELRTWAHAGMAVAPVVVGLVYLLTRTTSMDALLLGDDVATTSGHDAHRTRLVLMLVASIVTGAAVAVSGIISFVGLVVPHAVRLVVGAKHALLLPLSV